jgi:hypothetical protein
MLTERSRSSSRLKVPIPETKQPETEVKGSVGETAMREISDLKNEIARLTESLNGFASFTQSVH